MRTLTIILLSVLFITCEAKKAEVLPLPSHDPVQAKAYLEKLLTTTTIAPIEAVQEQIRGATLTLFLAFVGFILTVKGNPKQRFGWATLALIFIGLMYGLDTNEADLIRRVRDHHAQMESLFLKGDPASVDSALLLRMKGIAESDPCEKIRLALSKRLFENLWYGIPFFSSLGIGIFYFLKTRKQRKEDDESESLRAEIKNLEVALTEIKTSIDGLANRKNPRARRTD